MIRLRQRLEPHTAVYFAREMASPFLKPVGLFAGWSALVQAVTWSILSLIGIFAYKGQVIDAPTTPKTSNIFPELLFNLYFSENPAPCVRYLLNCEDVIIIVSIYLAASLVWLAVTLVMLTNLHKEEWKYTRNILLVWVATTGLTCALDFGVTIVFAIDYDKMLEDTLCYNSLTVPVFMMSLAARGYVLWVLNVAGVVYLTRAALRMEVRGHRRANGSQGSSVVSEMYQEPADSLPPYKTNMGYQNTEYALPALASVAEASRNTWSIQSPHVGESLRDNPWSFQPIPRTHQSTPLQQATPDRQQWTHPQQQAFRDPHPSGWDRQQPGRDRPQTRPVPVQNPIPPPSYIPEPDYDDESSSPQRKKFEPRPFDEVPRRSALKKHKLTGHWTQGRTAF